MHMKQNVKVQKDTLRKGNPYVSFHIYTTRDVCPFREVWTVWVVTSRAENRTGMFLLYPANPRER